MGSSTTAACGTKKHELRERQPRANRFGFELHPYLPQKKEQLTGLRVVQSAAREADLEMGSNDSIGLSFGNCFAASASRIAPVL
jgi:hypothetical protein